MSGSSMNSQFLLMYSFPSEDGCHRSQALGLHGEEDKLGMVI